ncbi:MAG: DUF5676 family membrane protein [Fimbriimonadaceae bacterium]
MRLNPVGMANALSGATAIIFVVCAIIVNVAWSFAISTFKSIFHGINVDPIVPAALPEFNFGIFLQGLVALVVLMWLFGLFLGLIYNATAGGREAS